MMQEVQMTDEEKLKMYLKLHKKELAKMVITCNTLIEYLSIELNAERLKNWSKDLPPIITTTGS